MKTHPLGVGRFNSVPRKKLGFWAPGARVWTLVGMCRGPPSSSFRVIQYSIQENSQFIRHLVGGSDDDWKDRKACWKRMKQEEAVSNKWQNCKYNSDD